MAGSANPIYTEVFPNQDFANAGYALWLKSPDAHGSDVKAFDDKYVYDRATELNWSDNASFKRFVHDLPLSPRCIPSGQAASDIRVSDTAFTFYSNCAAYQTSTARHFREHPGCSGNDGHRRKYRQSVNPTLTLSLQL